MSYSVEQLRELGQKIATDPDVVYNLSPDETAEVRKYLNPLGGVVTAKKIYCNLGLINWREKYLRRLHLTALVGYIYRTLEEYEPEAEIAKEIARYERAKKQVSTDNAALIDLSKKHEERLALIRSTTKTIIGDFLNRNFEFNPDHHLRSAHSENKRDPERKPRDDAIKDACKRAQAGADLDSKLHDRSEATYKYLRSNLLAAYQAAAEATSTVKAVLGVILDPNMKLDDKQGVLFKKYKQLLDITGDMKKLAEPLESADVLSAWTINPPVDVFHQFDRYLTNHYEQLRDVVQAFYSEKSDFEYAVVLYDAFKTPEAAREYKVQHEHEFKTEVMTIENSAVTLIGPFKENRARVDFYNKNTEVMKHMMEQLEADHKLGKDLMEKQVKSQKKKNIAEAGPDAPGLAAYSQTMNIVQELGAKKVLSKEEADKYAAAQKQAKELKDDYETPDDAIQVDMFFPQTSADGVTSLSKTKFYTQAEAPLHLQEGSAFVDQYQAKRGEEESLDTAYRTKVITGRNGQKMEIRVPAKGSK